MTLLFPTNNFGLGCIAIRKQTALLIVLLAQCVPRAKSGCKKAVLKKKERVTSSALKGSRSGAQVTEMPVLFTVPGESLLHSGKFQSCKCG